MFKAFAFGVTAILILAAVGCAPKKEETKKGVDAAGNCLPETKAAFNAIDQKSREYAANSDRMFLLGVTEACTQLRNLLGDNACNMENEKTGETMTVSYAERKGKCEAAQAILQNPQSGRGRTR